MWIILTAVLLLAVVFLLRTPSGSGKKGRGGKISFYAKGADAGFSLSEAHLLWQAVRMADIPVPHALFGSIEELDKTIRIITGHKKFTERALEDTETVLLGKLFDYRKKVEMSQPRYHTGLKTTRDITPGQHLTIRVDGVGLYTSEVVENAATFFTVTTPVGSPLPPGFSWRDKKLNVYFWRNGDAGYFFQSQVFNHYDNDYRYFRMAHSDDVLRSQKRKSIRASSNILARLYPLRSLELADELIESEPGISALIVDLSEDGAAIQIGGRSKKNQPYKVQFNIRGEFVVVSGLVKRVRFNSSEDHSILHMEFLPVPDQTRMIILSYVYDIDRSRKKAASHPPPVEDFPDRELLAAQEEGGEAPDIKEKEVEQKETAVLENLDDLGDLDDLEEAGQLEGVEEL